MYFKQILSVLSVYGATGLSSCQKSHGGGPSGAEPLNVQSPNAPVHQLNLESLGPAAQQGYKFLVNDNYIGCGIPIPVMQRAMDAKVLIPGPLMQAFFPTAASDVFTASGIPGRNQENAKIAPSFNAFTTERGVQAINFNCLSCHGDIVGDQFVVGLGNRTRDFTQDIRAFSKILPLFARTDAEREEVAIFNRSMEAIAPYVKTKTIGTNPAVNLTYALFAHRRVDDFTWSDAPLLAPPGTEFPPVDVPPWWRMKWKSSMFYNGEFVSNHHRVMMLASALCVKDDKAILAQEAKFKNLETFIKSLEAPRYPRPINGERASRGQRLYARHCAQCHGTYGDQGNTDYKTPLIPIEVVDTDPALMEQQTGPVDKRFREWGDAFSRNVYGEGMQTRENRGYIAPPLHGIWATAPYLHNGSVPSLEGVLNTRARPKFWQKTVFDPKQDYDIEGMSVRFRELSQGQNSALPLTKRYIYDTTLPGYGNGGHRFGDLLLQAERNAILEYLKTL